MIDNVRRDNDNWNCCGLLSLGNPWRCGEVLAEYTEYKNWSFCEIKENYLMSD